MRVSRTQLVKALLEIYGEQKDRSLFRINVIGRPTQKGGLEIKLGIEFTPEERAFAGTVLKDLEQHQLIIPTYADLISPTEALQITEAGLQALKSGRYEIAPQQEIFLQGGKGKNQYKLLEKLGSGGFGDVYKAFDAFNRKEVAVKIFQNNLNLAETDAFENWKREAEQAINIHDINVIESYEFKEERFPDGSKKCYLIMELADGGSLNEVIKKHKANNDFFSDLELKPLMVAVLNGMKAIHKVALHRDLKPENVLIVDNILKISDFGLARYVDESTRTRTFKGWGTPRYMAPESWKRGKMSKSTDIYSLGIMFFQLSTLELPYSSADDSEMEEMHLYSPIPSARRKNNKIPNRIDGIIKKMMQKSPGDRYPDIESVLIDLERPEPDSLVDVGELVSTAKSILDKEQQEKSEQNKKDEDVKRIKNMVNYKINELIKDVEVIVENINSQLPEEKLMLSKGSFTSFTLLWGKRDLLRIEFNPEIYDSNIKIDGQHIVASGSIRCIMARKDEGENLILIQNENDEYGTWKILEIMPSVLVPYMQYPRIYEYVILERISILGNAMDVITHSIRDGVDEEIKKMVFQAFDLIKNPRSENDMVSDFISFDNAR